MATCDMDVVIIGAGISGINAAYRLQTKCPNKSYTIIEDRFDMGGTWDLFQYPGIRSDSDLQTFGFAWRPWQGDTIARGDLIKTYIKESASLHGIDTKISYGHRLVGADWRSESQSWSLQVDVHDRKWKVTARKTFNAKFLILGTGYYNYEEPLDVVIHGLENFKGTVVHPQFWPGQLDYKDKKVVIIGSGATAVTLLPVLAETAGKVTMLQRSPGYIVARPKADAVGDFIKRWLPLWLAHEVIRLRFSLLGLFFFNFCKAYPEAAKRALKKRTSALLPPNVEYSPHFEPKYNPWDQRMCLCPDGDFYTSLHAGKAGVATGVVETMTSDKIILESGQEIEADIIVTATGLKLRVGGGAKISVDGEPYEVGKHFVWRGVMLQNLPNAALVLGYTNASWTLGADAAALHICRLLNSMDIKGQTSVVPFIEDPDSVKPMQAMNLKSTYLIRAKGTMPMAGDKAPWTARRNYFIDTWQSRRSNLVDGLKFFSVST